ncbi:MAG: folate-binding protein, partial [Mariprofundaceae bacterium]|nr:folate-binding protein [Mariprofundaceae bacterium]
MQAHIVAERTSWSVLKASGEGLRDYLQGQITQDINILKPGQAIHACLLSAQGKAVSELYICEGRHDELFLLTPSPVATLTVERLRRFALGYDLRIGLLDSYAIFSLQGAQAGSQLAALGLNEPAESWLASRQAESADCVAIVMPGEPRGYWLIGEKDAVQKAFPNRTEEEVFEAMRIIRGLPRFGSEWNASLHPLNANLIEFSGVSFDKGCYVGQEVTSRMHWRGGIKKKL